MIDLSALEREALTLSLQVASWCLIAGLPLALGLGVLLARAQFAGKAVIHALVHLPLVLPPVATGYLLLMVFGRKGPLGAALEDWFGIVIAFRWTGAVVAAIVMALPLMVRPIHLALEAVDRDLEEAARTLGAGRLAIFATVTLPLAMPGIIAAAILGFAKALGEFGATITFVANIPGETRTLPLAIHTALQIPGEEGSALRLTALALAISVSAVIASELIARRIARRIAA